MKTKYIHAQITKSEPGATDGAFVLSSESVDRDGDIISVDGWDLENFRKNPVALWQHDQKQPIGYWENIRVKGTQLIGDLVLASTNLAQMARQLIEDDVLRAVSVGFKPTDMEPRDKDNPFSGYLIKGAELLEASLVSVPANPDALMISKALGLSDDELSVVFEEAQPAGKSADPELLARASELVGKSAAVIEPRNTPHNDEARPMKLSERIEEKRAELVALRDELTKHSEQYAEDASEENAENVKAFAEKVEECNKQLETLELAEQNLAKAVSQPAQNQAPAIVTSTKNPDPGELVFRHAAVKWLGWRTNKTTEQIVRERYPHDKDLSAYIAKADASPGDTTTSAWAASLLDQQVESFVDLLANNSVYGALRGPGLSLNFSGVGSIKIPSRTATATPSGAFVGEAAPIPVKELSFTSKTLTRHKMGVIVTMSEELIDATNGQIEAVVRQAVLDETGKVLDTTLMDSTAGSAIRPAGLLNGVTPTASAGDTVANIITDVKALLSGFNNDDAGKNLRILLHPQRVLGLSTVTNSVGEMQFADEVGRGSLLGIPLVVSANVGTDVVHCVNAGEFATAYDGPQFDESNTATLHMEDTSPAEIVSGTGPTTADPVRSLYQTYTRAIRMILPVTWDMRRDSQVSSLSSVSW